MHKFVLGVVKGPTYLTVCTRMRVRLKIAVFVATNSNGRQINCIFGDFNAEFALIERYRKAIRVLVVG